MQITCTHCQRQLNLPDDKVPDRPFALTCPACHQRFQVDLRQPAPAPPPAVDTPAPPPSAPPASAPPAGGDVQFDELLPTRDLDKDLLRGLYPVAAIVNLSGLDPAPFEAGLRLIGMEDIRHFTELAGAVEEMLETDFSVLTVLLDRATAPPCEPLKPLYDLPLSVRRGTFVALVAENVRSLDGQTAFYLQVNCLVSSQEITKFPLHLQRALLFHLRLYRFWGIRDE